MKPTKIPRLSGSNKPKIERFPKSLDNSTKVWFCDNVLNKTKQIVK